MRLAMLDKRSNLFPPGPRQTTRQLLEKPTALTFNASSSDILRTLQTTLKLTSLSDTGLNWILINCLQTRKIIHCWGVLRRERCSPAAVIQRHGNHVNHFNLTSMASSRLTTKTVSQSSRWYSQAPNGHLKLAQRILHLQFLNSSCHSGYFGYLASPASGALSSERVWKTERERESK